MKNNSSDLHYGAKVEAKQESINRKLTERFEQYLETIKASLSKKHGVKRKEMKKKGIRYDWRHIRNIMSSHTIITTRMKLKNKDSLIIRQPSRANQHAAQIYNALQFKQSNPDMRKKSVVSH